MALAVPVPVALAVPVPVALALPVAVVLEAAVPVALAVRGLLPAANDAYGTEEGSDSANATRSLVAPDARKPPLTPPRMSERAAARAALTQLEYEREAACPPDRGSPLAALPPLPAYLSPQAGAPPAPALPVQPLDALHHGGGGLIDVGGLAAGSALDCGGRPPVMPGDRLATTLLFPAAAAGDSEAAQRQRKLHKQNEILQGLYVGHKETG